jgi:hypothetical protein
VELSLKNAADLSSTMSGMKYVIPAVEYCIMTRRMTGVDCILMTSDARFVYSLAKLAQVTAERDRLTEQLGGYVVVKREALMRWWTDCGGRCCQDTQQLCGWRKDCAKLKATLGKE